MIEQATDLSPVTEVAGPRCAFVRGRKDGVKRLVEVLWEPHVEGKPYRRCIVPLSDIEARSVRRRHFVYYRDKLAKPPVDKVSLPVTCHDTWIHEDRLEYV